MNKWFRDRLRQREDRERQERVLRIRAWRLEEAARAADACGAASSNRSVDGTSEPKP